MRFCEKIRALREEKEISLNALARKIDVSPSYLSEIERGVKLPPSGKIIMDLARELKHSAEDLVWLANQERAPKEVKDSFVEEMQVMFRGMGTLPEDDRKAILKFYQHLKEEHEKGDAND